MSFTTDHLDERIASSSLQGAVTRTIPSNSHDISMEDNDSHVRTRNFSEYLNIFYYNNVVSILIETLSDHNPWFCIARRPVIDTIHVHDLGTMNIRCPYCDALHWEDEKVSSSRVR